LKGHVALACSLQRSKKTPEQLRTDSLDSPRPDDPGPRKGRSTGSGDSSIQGREGLLLTVIDRENCRQLGNLQHIAQALSQAGEADVGPSRARGRVNPDQRSQTATVDIGHVGKVQDQLPSVAQSLFQTCPQRICLFPEHDAPVTGDYRDALDQPFLDLEAHFVPPKRPQARACEKINMIAPQCKADEA